MLADDSPTVPPMRGIQVLRRAADRRPVTRGTALRRVRPQGFRRTRDEATVEALTLRIAALVLERQHLRGSDAGATELERNRLEIAGAQWELAHALIDRHLPRGSAATAA
jgi:hypothetical protein